MSLREYREYNKLIDNISKSILNNCVSHAYIIEADSCVDKLGFVKNFIKAVMCREMPGYGCDECVICRKIEHDNYEDVYYVEPNGQSIKVKQISEFCSDLTNMPIGGERNFGIINHADSMTIQSQNKLLKTLEEPNPGTVIFLLSDNTENLLQTINSRCITYRLGNFSDNLISEKMEYARNVLEMVKNGTYFIDIREFLSKNIRDRSEALELLDGLERIFREYLLDRQNVMYSDEKIINSIGYIETARRQILANVSHKYAIRNLILKIGG